MSNDQPIVVAPRPVRLGAIFTRRQDTDFAFIADISSPDPPDRLSRPPSTTATTLPSEALDEFLSILKPSFLRKPRSVSFPAFLPDRPLALRQLPRVDSRTDNLVRDPCASSSDDVDPITTSPSHMDNSLDSRLFSPDSDTRQWFSSALLGMYPPTWFKSSAILLTLDEIASPVSRFHTRNPFQRNREGSPVPPSPLSPASIPLPAPSPGELFENI